ncbi:nucleoside-diphosphate-sugar epimerase [Microbacteriaceae bacterium SG_E_30_P1]|uniref:Nucleoside-diphosphate-sugar epimerase n=1 Tax=Antiquaquibacter oligotrophicus TaxID=2880260 RepID=A0ABT6KMB3_9MICO|nr:NAD(P)-dependent oxidoreductase [Antiquaquibacter oligotrophicus]MDH6180272.1 nucleoside-diphosphate-sugar epimerase [Antiquaquibacter oligotrophicus]UDF13981.1 NAD(P)-dependent oxidoreductase [Antiquaquibacter oligotrophicus]
MRIAVTGASGFVGGAVATALVARGHDVTGFGRRPHGWRGTYEQWDLAHGPHRGSFDAVVHSAALADDWAPLGDAMLANRLGTRNVVTSFPGARLVHISTSSVYDAFGPNVRSTEDEPIPTRFLSSYSESKVAAERELPTDAVILRPHAVYGPGDTTLLPRILEGIRGRRLVLPEGARVRHTLTHIDNLIHAVELALRGPAGVYNVGDDTEVLLSAVLGEFLSRRGRPDVTITSVPYRAAFAAAGALERAARLKRTRPPITRYAISQVGLERTFDLSRARDLLGYRPGPTSLAGAEDW